MFNENDLSDLAKERLTICKKCPLFKDDPEKGYICNPAKYLSPDGETTSYFAKPGWVRGCSCLILLKINKIQNHCVAKKW